MCGRYTLRSKPMAIAEEFDLPEVPPLHPRFNIAPNQPVPVVRFDPSEVSRLVNDPGNDAPECIQSIETNDWLPGL